MKGESYRRARKQLADNLKAAINESNVNAAAKKHKIPQKTLDNLTKLAIDPQLSTISRVAHGFGQEVWELLCPNYERTKTAAALKWLRLYDRTSPAARRAIESALQFAEEEADGNLSGEGTVDGRSGEGSR